MFGEREVIYVIVETQVIERLKRMTERMENILGNILIEFFYKDNIRLMSRDNVIDHLVSLSDSTVNLKELRKLREKFEEKVEVEELLKIAIEIIRISQGLSEDDCKKVFQEVAIPDTFRRALMRKDMKGKMLEEVSELLWFMTEGAPIYQWTKFDSDHRDVWNFNYVESLEEFRKLIRTGNRELIYPKFQHIKIAYGIKTTYFELDKKEDLLKRFRNIAGSDVSEEEYHAALNLLFPDKYTVATYYVYIP